MLHRELFVLIFCYVRIMLFWIENQYSNMLKISDLQIHQWKESNLEDLRVLKFQKISRLRDRVIILSISINIAGLIHNCSWSYMKEKMRHLQDWATITSWVSSLALYMWQFKTWDIFLLHSVLECKNYDNLFALTNIREFLSL